MLSVNELKRESNMLHRISVYVRRPDEHKPTELWISKTNDNDLACLIATSILHEATETCERCVVDWDEEETCVSMVVGPDTDIDEFAQRVDMNIMLAVAYQTGALR